MKLFSCDHCGNTVYFENATCERCGHTLGYAPDHGALLSLDDDNGAWTSPARPSERFIFCANAQHGACNWLVAETPGGDIFCAACRHNETIPPIADPANLGRWQTIERAKKRLFYALIRLGLPLRTRDEDPDHGLAFRFLADDSGAKERVMTGHDTGTITIALSEADDAEREYRRTSMNEPYRTLLGHFRHEIGHHFWDLLVAGQPFEGQFRALFGDERVDYGQALEGYYANGAPQGWSQTHISAYATAHPWEDFAETFAHYLHIIDTLEMAAAFGVRARPQTGDEHLNIPPMTFDPYMAPDMALIIEDWVPLASLINNLNRAVGQADAYPFVLTPGVIDKLAFINTLVHQAPALSQLDTLSRAH
ncbi:putative zinc-binding peptidase [Devosia sp. XJ19-1]|uniref:Zinc-binding peptidase n=1 Tax=Devosia ureilytica TaxID=2952754 RepID=A0A9Q4AR02_9HYPH|nr:putative zinc-binding peptidase [Devosia ureilytica]MCP8884595.1 putative zinc-binding peptidase [Devosia ureilytica]MCP8888225.1 putative zinc-binding peptidase [Devosia ureilytica]